MSQQISVVYTINGTTQTDNFTCESSAVHLTGVYADSGTVVTMDREDGVKSEAFYRHAELITRLTDPQAEGKGEKK